MHQHPVLILLIILKKLGLGIKIWTTLSFLCFALDASEYIKSQWVLEWRRKQVGFIFGIWIYVQIAHPAPFIIFV